MFDVFSFESDTLGPHVLVLGGVHGSEPCGIGAADAWVKRLNVGHEPLKSGKVTIIPRVNRRACQQGERFIDTDLNRCFTDPVEQSTYEGKLAANLLPHIQACDFMLDLHGTKARSPSFIFRDFDTELTVSLSMRLGAQYVLSGWQNVFPISASSGGTLAACQRAGKEGLLFEGGQRDSPQSLVACEQAVRYLLIQLGMLGGRAPSEESCELCLSDVVIKTAPGDFRKDWQGFDFVSKGETIAVYDNGQRIMASHDAYLICPDRESRIGERWVYLYKSTVHSSSV